LARRTGIPQATISAIENDRVRLGVERARILAQALQCHPAVLVFPGWEIARDSAA
jgi:transcriptional regulator with XRE-family HTH domain